VDPQRGLGPSNSRDQFNPVALLFLQVHSLSPIETSCKNNRATGSCSSRKWARRGSIDPAWSSQTAQNALTAFCLEPILLTRSSPLLDSFCSRAQWVIINPAAKTIEQLSCIGEVLCVRGRFHCQFTIFVVLVVLSSRRQIPTRSQKN
jgi:hypothetical protein